MIHNYKAPERSGLNFIEIAIGIGIVFMVTITLIGMAGFSSMKNGNITYTVNGAIESRCIDGYKFVISQDSTRQVLDEFGKGVRCNREGL